MNFIEAHKAKLSLQARHTFVSSKRKTMNPSHPSIKHHKKEALFSNLKKVATMRSLMIICVACFLSSCALETYQCPSYGETNVRTKAGNKAQAKYARHNRHRNFF